MDKNNLIQKLQNGGSVVQLEEYVPGKILEKAVADTIEYARYNRDFEEEQRQFENPCSKNLWKPGEDYYPPKP